MNKLPEHLFWLMKAACRQELKAVEGLMTATNLNHYVMSWALAFYSTGDKDHAYGRLERVYRLQNAQPQLKDKPVYPVALTEPLKSCRSCNASIYWTQTDAGKTVPVDVNGQSHFLTCPNATEHSKGS